jgi:hypothetical protein
LNSTEKEENKTYTTVVTFFIDEIAGPRYLLILATAVSM